MRRTRANIDMMHPAETKTPDTPDTSRKWPKALLFWGAALTVFALDQATKAIVRATLERGESWPSADWPVRIRYVTNTGAAFGILEDQTVFLIAMACIGLAAIYLYYRYPPFDHPIAPVAIGMMLGGAAGNLFDRVRLGEVTDFIDFPSYPAFNVADSSLTIAIATVILGYLAFAPKTKPAADENAGADG
jgi:signal peptidase II